MICISAGVEQEVGRGVGDMEGARKGGSCMLLDRLHNLVVFLQIVVEDGRTVVDGCSTVKVGTGEAFSDIIYHSKVFSLKVPISLKCFKEFLTWLISFWSFIGISFSGQRI